jgi:hypothetical protein
MDSLEDILRGTKKFAEPPEIAAIKSYVEQTFHSAVGVVVQPTNIIITAASAALINTLRLQTVQLQKAAHTTKKLIFRISGD